ncbi:hypothetical protein [Senegalia massiliensis]|uniref:hypothetical protein n=1 Tax=Senegalia massiliensis TaxID=1720316 RepID=UPI001031BFDF|nr:hypothetical protein [Senegalia massiliensis]
MKKNFNLENISDDLAVQMWGELLEKHTITKGVIYYHCKDYDGIIFNDKEFNLDPKIKRNINPMVIIEIYNYRGKKYVIERTNNKEKIPQKLKNKFENKRCDDSISIYALTEGSVKLLKYYHRNIIKNIYKKEIEPKVKKYKSINGFINSEIRDAIKYLALNEPEFIKKKDKDLARKIIEKKLDEELKRIKNLNLKDEENLIIDRYKQRKDLIK